MTSLPCERLLVIACGAVDEAGLAMYLTHLRRELAEDILVVRDFSPGQQFGAWPQTALVLPATEAILQMAATGLMPAVPKPVVFAPAMPESSWLMPDLRDAVANLRSQGHHVIEPTTGAEPIVRSPKPYAGPTVELVLAHTMHVVFRQLRATVL